MRRIRVIVGVLIMVSLLATGIGQAFADGTVNENLSYTGENPVSDIYVQPDLFCINIIAQPESYNPQTVLVTGVLFAPYGCEITNAGLMVGSDLYSTKTVYRFRNAKNPEELSQMNVEVDASRSGYAFFIDLSHAENLGSKVDTRVKMEINGLQLDVGYTVRLNPALAAYPDIVHALDGYCIEPRDQNELVNDLQESLKNLNYLSEDKLSGIYDEETQKAMEAFCRTNELNYSEHGITTEMMSKVVSTMAIGKESGFMGFMKESGLMGFLMKDLTIGNFELKMWMVVAGAALLVLIILVILLIVIHKKKKGASQSYDSFQSYGHTSMGTENPEIYRTTRDIPLTAQEPAPSDGPNILSVGDEETVSLGEQEQSVVVRGDQPTQDAPMELSFKLMVRMIYQGVYADQNARMTQGVKLIIGRGNAAQIQTNDADTSVSHQHGMFYVQDRNVRYMDMSKNGTRVNQTSVLHRDESIVLPVGTKMQLDMGSHQVLVLVQQQ